MISDEIKPMFQGKLLLPTSRPKNEPRKNRGCDKHSFLFDPENGRNSLL
jgi:hypothetical protein